MFTGDSLFINEFTAGSKDGEICLAPASPGDADYLYLDNETLYIQNSAFVAPGKDVNIETKFQGLVKGFFSGKKLFQIKCCGRGDLWFNSYRGNIAIDVDGEYVVDTGHIVAFTETSNIRSNRLQV